MQLRFYVKFQGEATYTEITQYIKYNSVKFDVVLLNKKFRSTQDSVKAQTIFDETINSKFNSATEYLEAYIEKTEEWNVGYGTNQNLGYIIDQNYGFSEEGTIFTGAIYPNTREKLQDPAIEGISFEIIDNSYKLEKDNEAFQYPSTIGSTGYYVFNPSDTTNSIIHQWLATCGVTDIDSSVSILETVEFISREENKTTYKKLIDDLLYEFHHAFYFDEDGKFCLYDWKHDTITTTETIQTNNILNKKGIQRRRNILDFDGYKITYVPLETKLDALLYRESIDEDGMLLLAGQAFPTTGETEDIYQRFSNEWLTDEAKIIGTSGNSISSTKDNDISIITEIYENTRAQVVFKNTGTTDQRLYTFDIRGNVIFENGDAERLVPENIEKTKDIKLKYAHTQDQADEFGESLYNNVVRYGQYLYKFDSEEYYDISTKANIITDYYSVDVIIYRRTYDPYLKLYSYDCIGAGNHITETIGGETTTTSAKSGDTAERAYVVVTTTAGSLGLKINVSDFEETLESGSAYLFGYTVGEIPKDIPAKVKYNGVNVSIDNQTIYGIANKKAFIFYDVSGNTSPSAITAYFDASENIFNDNIWGDIETTYPDAIWVQLGYVEMDATTITASFLYENVFDMPASKLDRQKEVMKYLNEATDSISFDAIATSMGIDNAFTTLAAYEAFINSLYVKYLQVIDGTFSLKANSTDGLAITKDSINLLDVDPATGDVTIGNISAGGLKWDNATNQLKSKDEKLIIGTDGTITAQDGIFNGNVLVNGLYYQDTYVVFLPTNVILNSFTSPSSLPKGLTSDGTNLISCDSSTGLIYIHDGTSSTILSSFASPAAYPSGLAFDGTNLISCDHSSDMIYIHDGISATILSSFASPDTLPHGLTFDGTNLISCDNNTDTIYIHDGISATILSSFASPSSNPTGLAFDGTNLISCDGISNIIYIHSGISSDILNSFTGPVSWLHGLTFKGINLISCDIDADKIYVHRSQLLI